MSVSPEDWEAEQAASKAAFELESPALRISLVKLRNGYILQPSREDARLVSPGQLTKGARVYTDLDELLAALRVELADPETPVSESQAELLALIAKEEETQAILMGKRRPTIVQTLGPTPNPQE